MRPANNWLGAKMRRAFLPIATALISALVGPLAATFPFWIFLPFVGAMAVFAGFPLAAFAGLVFGIAFSLMPPDKLQDFSNQRRAKRFTLLALFGAACGVLCYPILLIVMDAVATNGSNSPNRSTESVFIILSFLAYGGVLSSFILWPLVKFMLAPSRALKRDAPQTASPLP